MKNKKENIIVIDGKEYPIAKKDSKYYLVGDVMQILGISQGKAYVIMRKLNLELKEKGYITIAGRISKRYFNEKYYS